MLELDGAAGGGQQLRTALALSVADGRPFRMERIRDSRPNPGLRPQHLTAVRVAADLCDADLRGATVGSSTLTFRPGDDRADTISVDVGTAGSLTLVFDTLLPVADWLDTDVQVTATGGTDVKWSPPFDYLRRVKLPFLARFGLDADLSLTNRGFYPAGGGEATLSLSPSSLSSLDVTARGDLESVAVYSVASAGLADADVAERQATHACDLLADAGLPTTDPTVTYAETHSPGTALVVRGAYEQTLVGFDALGERGVPAEAVADGVVADFLTWRDGPGAVDANLADQLLVFLARAGGAVWIPTVTDHVETNLDVIRTFGYAVDCSSRDDGSAVVEA